MDSALTYSPARGIYIEHVLMTASVKRLFRSVQPAATHSVHTTSSQNRAVGVGTLKKHSSLADSHFCRLQWNCLPFALTLVSSQYRWHRESCLKPGEVDETYKSRNRRTLSCNLVRRFKWIEWIQMKSAADLPLREQWQLLTTRNVPHYDGCCQIILTLTWGHLLNACLLRNNSVNSH